MALSLPHTLSLARVMPLLNVFTLYPFDTLFYPKPLTRTFTLFPSPTLTLFLARVHHGFPSPWDQP